MVALVGVMSRPGGVSEALVASRSAVQQVDAHREQNEQRLIGLFERAHDPGNKRALLLVDKGGLGFWIGRRERP